MENEINVLALDTESQTYNKGHVFDNRHKLVCYSFATEEASTALQWDEKQKKNCQALINCSDLVIGFNLKYDYHVLNNAGVDLTKSNLWDVQLAEFILSNQTHKFPSLNETCEKYGISLKLDVVANEYWAKDIQTDEIPWEILSEYAAHDAYVTLQCYYKQIALMTDKQKQLCRLMCQDMHVLREMEYNGLVFDEQLCNTRAEEIDAKIKTINNKLSATYSSIAINFNSGDQLSAFLYGGVVKEETKEHIGFFKTGDKKGQPKYKNVTIEHILPRLYEPLKGSELAKEGLFATDEPTLKKLKGNKTIVNMLLELAKLEKLNGTYYKGLPELRKTMYWPENILHGQFNQCSVATGRLSSSRPNLQNFASDLQDIFISRYAN